MNTNEKQKDFPKQLFQLPPTTTIQRPHFIYNEQASEVIVHNSADILSLYSVNGQKKREVRLPTGEPLLTFEVSTSGVIAVMTTRSVWVFTLNEKVGETRKLSAEQPFCLRWNPKGCVLAVGTLQGSLVFYDITTERENVVEGKHSKKVLSLDWHLSKGYLLSLGQDRSVAVSKENGDAVPEAPGQILSIATDFVRWISFYPGVDAEQTGALKELLSEKEWALWVGLARERRAIIVSNAAISAEPCAITLSVAVAKPVDFFWEEKNQTLLVVGAKGLVVSIPFAGSTAGTVFTHDTALLPNVECCAFDPVTTELLLAGEDSARILLGQKPADRFKQKFTFEKTNSPFVKAVLARGVMLLMTFTGQLFCILTRIDRDFRVERHIALRASLDEVKFKSLTGGPWRLIKSRQGVIARFLLSYESLFLLSSSGFEEYELSEGNFLKAEFFDHGELLNAEVEPCTAKIILLFKNQVMLRDTLGLRRLGSVPTGRTCLALDRWLGFVCVDTIVFAFSLESGELCAKVEAAFSPRSVSICPSRAEILFLGEEGILENYCLAEGTHVFGKVDAAAHSVTLDEEFPGLFVVCLPDSQLLTSRFGKGKLRVLRAVIDEEGFVAEGGEPMITLISPELALAHLRGGQLYCIDSCGELNRTFLSTHAYIQEINPIQQLSPLVSELSISPSCFWQALEAGDVPTAVMCAKELCSPALWEAATRVALKDGLITEARECMAQLGRKAEAQMLDDFSGQDACCEQILMAAMQGDFTTVRTLVLSAEEKEMALQIAAAWQSSSIVFELSKVLDLQPSWLKLAVAEDLLQVDELVAAGRLFEEVLADIPRESQAILGQARCMLRRGAVTRSLELSLDLDSERLCRLAETAQEYECWPAAFDLFSRAGEWTEAAFAALHAAENGDESRALQLVPEAQKANKDALLALGRYFRPLRPDVAEKFFRIAGESEELIECLLTRSEFSAAEQEFLASCAQSTAAAALLANSFKSFPELGVKAIRYFVLAGQKAEGIAYALEHNLLEFAADELLALSAEEALVAANALHAQGKFAAAGKFFSLAGEKEMALKNFLRAEEFEAANQLVASLENPELLEYICGLYSGEQDLPPQPTHLLRLYLLLRRYGPANELAVSLVMEELEAGKYKAALRKAADMVGTLGLHAGFELRQKLFVLQLYSLARRCLATDDNPQAALLLHVVAAYLQLFPRHATSILTSTVVAATKAGYRHIAYQWAVALHRPELRGTVEEKFRERVEKLALRPIAQPPNWFAEINEELRAGFSKCLCCAGVIEDPFAISCPRCAIFLAHCACSGRTLVTAVRWNVVRCTVCGALALRERLEHTLNKARCCPLCEAPIALAHFAAVTAEEVKACIGGH